MAAMRVEGLRKAYPAFTLDNVSFAIGQGRVVGFIGRNGAGKTTTLRAALGFLKRDGGTVEILGMPFTGREDAVKERIGYVAGAADYYPRRTLSVVASVARAMYRRWDETTYRSLLKAFALDETKTLGALSQGMKVKFALALALSHRAELLILDEPTSGLDPVSRDQLLDTFLDLVRDGKTTLLFSTHITGDLDRCADDILYIRQGKLLASQTVDAFLDAYRLARFDGLPASETGLIGLRRDRTGSSALVRKADADAKRIVGATLTRPALEDVMVFLERDSEAAK